jgi:hypothetical protein
MKLTLKKFRLAHKMQVSFYEDSEKLEESKFVDQNFYLNFGQETDSFKLTKDKLQLLRVQNQPFVILFTDVDNNLIYSTNEPVLDKDHLKSLFNDPYGKLEVLDSEDLTVLMNVLNKSNLNYSSECSYLNYVYQFNSAIKGDILNAINRFKLKKILLTIDKILLIDKNLCTDLDVYFQTSSHNLFFCAKENNQYFATNDIAFSTYREKYREFEIVALNKEGKIIATSSGENENLPEVCQLDQLFLLYFAEYINTNDVLKVGFFRDLIKVIPVSFCDLFLSVEDFSPYVIGDLKKELLIKIFSDNPLGNKYLPRI